jgi:hypothetical protein
MLKRRNMETKEYGKRNRAHPEKAEVEDGRWTQEK